MFNTTETHFRYSQNDKYIRIILFMPEMRNYHTECFINILKIRYILEMFHFYNMARMQIKAN